MALGTGNPGSGIVFAYLLGEGALSGGVGMASSTNSISQCRCSKTLAALLLHRPCRRPMLQTVRTVVVNLTESAKYLYIPFSDGSVWGYAIDGSSGA